MNESTSRWPLVVPICTGMMAVLLFFAQGGFAGGHADYDGLIILFTLPGSSLLWLVPLPEWLLRFTPVYLLAFPISFNLLLVQLVRTLWAKRDRERRGQEAVKKSLPRRL